MPRMTDYQQDMHDATRREGWSLRGPNQIVKVVPASGPAATQMGGYITVGKYLLNKTPAQIETDLGLPLNYLTSGARIYRFLRLPLVQEYEYDLTTQYPGGLAYNPAHSDPNYPPGHRAIHQWRIKPGVMIPVDPHYLELKPSDHFPYTWLI